MKRKSVDKNDTTTARAAVDRNLKQWSGGDFFDPNASRSLPREIAQRQFLELARQLYHVTAVLRDNVHPHYARIGTGSDEDERAISELGKWCSRYQLGQPWVLTQLRITLDLWTMCPQVSRLDDDDPPWHPTFQVVMRRPRPANTVPFVFNFVCPTFEITPEGEVNRLEASGWDVELDRREDFVAEARKQFSVALGAYCDEQERRAEARGLEKVKRRRHRDISWGAKITWAVQRRCGRMEFERIAGAYAPHEGRFIDESTVIKAVNEIFGLIDGDSPEPARVP